MLKNTLDVLWLSPYDYKPGSSLYMHSHPYYQLIYILRGEGTFSYGLDEFNMGPGCNFLIHSGQEHALINTGSDTLKTLDIKFHVFDDGLIRQLEAMNPHLCITTKETETYWNRIKEINRLKPSFYKDEIRLNMSLLLLHLIRLGNPRCRELLQDNTADFLSNDNEIMQAFMDFIQKNYQKDLSLETIADAIGYNKSYLCQIFRKYYNSTPIRFLYAYRIQIAKKLIQQSEYDLKYIAQITGFNSIHHFSRTFSHTVGISPGAYRDNEKGGICQDINVDESFENMLYIMDNPSSTTDNKK